MAANESAANFDETELPGIIALMEGIMITLMIILSMEETGSVDDDGCETTLPGGDEDCTTSSSCSDHRHGRRWLCVA